MPTETPDEPAKTHAEVTPRFVDRAEDLEAFAQQVDAADSIPIALDTEADSFHHYFEKVCLLQIACGPRVALVDPLAVDLAPLLSRLQARRLLMHGADYDLRLLHRGHAFRATHVFDTMIAAQLLGEPEIGLAALLGKRVGVALDKVHQRADWSERPLSKDQLAYAAADVLYLPALVASLEKDLLAKGRLPWHREECGRLVSAPFTQREDDPENDWRLKGTNGMSGKERAFVKALWEARETRAKAIDRPPFRVLPNDKLLHAASLAARGESDTGKLFPMQRPLPPPFARALREALEATRALAPEAWPGPKRSERGPDPDPALENAVERLKKKRDALSQELDLSPSVLAPKAALTAAARALLSNNTRLSPEGLAGEAGISLWRATLLLG